MTMMPKPEGYRFRIPEADERKALLDVSLDAFLTSHRDDKKLPYGFMAAIEELIDITTNKKSFAKYLRQDPDQHTLHKACQFISEKTVNEEDKGAERCARDLQDQLINGLMRRWMKNVEKINEENPDLEKKKFQQLATNSDAGGFVLAALQALLESNIQRMVNSPQTKNHHALYRVPKEDLMADGYLLFNRCMFSYRETPKNGKNPAHFKTYLESHFEHFAKYYVRNHKHELRAKSELSIDDVGGDMDERASIASMLPDHRELSEQELTDRDAQKEQLREAITKLGDRDREIIEATLRGDTQDFKKTHVVSARRNLENALRDLNKDKALTQAALACIGMLKPKDQGVAKIALEQGRKEAVELFKKTRGTSKGDAQQRVSKITTELFELARKHLEKRGEGVG